MNPNVDLATKVVDITVEDVGGGGAGTVTGSGTAGYLAKFVGASEVGNALGYETAGRLVHPAATITSLKVGTFSNSANATDEFVWPEQDGTNGQRLVTDGAGNLSWADAFDIANVEIPMIGDVIGTTAHNHVVSFQDFPFGSFMSHPQDVGVISLLAFQSIGGEGGAITLGWDPFDPDNLAIAGDVTGNLGAATVAKLQGRSISTTTPTHGQVLMWDANISSWIPQTFSGGGGGGGVLNGDVTGPYDNNHVYCIARGVVDDGWAPPSEGQVFMFTSNAWRASSTMGIPIYGAMSGTLGNCVLATLCGHPLPNDPLALVAGDVLRLVMDGGSLVWEGTSWADFAVQLEGDVNGAAQANELTVFMSTAIDKNATYSTLPDYLFAYYDDGLGNVSWARFDIGAYEVGGEVTGLLGALTVDKLWNIALDLDDTPANGDMIQYSTAAAKWTLVQPGAGGPVTLSGDCTGPAGSNTVTKIQGRVVLEGAPSTGSTFIYTGTAWGYTNCNYVTLQPGYPGTVETGNVYISGRMTLGDKLSIGTVTGFALSVDRTFSTASGDEVLVYLAATGTAAYNHITTLQATAIASRNGWIDVARGGSFGTTSVTGGLSLDLSEGIRLWAYHDVGTLMNTRTGLHIENISGGGSVVTQYGIYVEALTAGAVSNYALYTAGATPSYFGGAVTMPVSLCVGESTAYPLSVKKLYGTTGSNAFALFSQATRTAADAGVDVWAAYSAASTEHTSGNVGGAYAFRGFVGALGSGGTTGSIASFMAEGQVGPGSTAVDRYGLYVDEISGAGTLTNQYGLYVAALTKGGTYNYAVYTAGTTPSYFGGRVSIGLENTAEKFYVYEVRNDGYFTSIFARTYTTAQGSPATAHGFYLSQNAAETGDRTTVLISAGARNSSGTVAKLVGLNAIASCLGGFGGAQTVTEAVGVTAGVELGEGSTVTTFYCFKAKTAVAVGGGSLGTQVGLYVDALSGGGTANYAIYTAGTTPSYFGGNVGIGATPSTNVLTLAQSVAATGAAMVALDTTLTATAVDANGRAAIRGLCTTGITSGTMGTLIGVVGRVTMTGSGGTVTNVYSAQVTADVGTGATMTARTGLLVVDATGAGTITNQYGIYINSLTKAATGNFAIYVAASTKSYFGGNVGIGATSPVTALEVGGDILISNTQAFRWRTSTGTYANAKLMLYSDNYLYIDNPDGHIIFRGTSFAEKMRIQSDGFVGIGATSPYGRLHITDTRSVNSATTLSLDGTITQTGGGGVRYGLVIQSNTTTGANNTDVINQVYIKNPTLSSGGGTNQNLRGIEIVEQTGAARNTNLYIGSSSTVYNVPDGNFSLYSQSTRNSYFAGNVGISAIPSYPLHVYQATGTTGASSYGVVYIGVASGADASQGRYGVYSQWQNTITSGSIYWIQNYRAWSSLSGNGGTTSLITAYQAAGPTVGTGHTASNVVGLYVENANGAGTVSYQYGVFVQGLTKGATANWAIYTDGTTGSYFGGPIGIGVGPVGAKLSVLLPAAINTYPAAGSYGGAAIFHCDSSAYGVYVGAISNGEGYVQAQRGDSATTYGLHLNPNGGAISGEYQPRVICWQNSAGTSLTGSAGTVVLFDTNSAVAGENTWSGYPMHSTSVNTGWLYAPVAGFYLYHFSVTLTGTPGELNFRVVKTGGVVLSQNNCAAGASSGNIWHRISGTCQLAAGEYVYLDVYNYGTAKTTTTGRSNTMGELVKLW